MSFTALPNIEAFGNNDLTTLAASVAVPDTIISGTSVAGFPTNGQFRLLIGNELLQVIGYDLEANQWQVVRGIEGTTAATHAMGDQVACILTKGSLVTLKENAGTTFVYRDSEPSPTGNVFPTFDGAYAAARSLGVPSTIVIDDTIAQCSIGNATNFGAVYSTVVGTTATITGLLNMTPEVVGLYLALSTEGPAENNGTFLIIAYLSPTSVQVTNAEAISGVSNYAWYLIDGLSASIESVTGANGTSASITAFANPLATVSGLANMTPAMVGQSLVLNNISLQGSSASITAFDGTLATISGLTNMSPVLVGQNLNLNFTASGSSASITAFDGTLATVVGLTGMNPAFVGQSLNLSGSVNSGNNGSFVIFAYISPTSVQVTNPSAVSPDSGPLSWGVTDPNSGSWTISAYISATSVQITNPATVFPDSSLFVWSTTDPNNGTWSIAAFISSTSVQITNSSAVSPDPGPFFWYVSGASNLCALVTGVAADPSLVGQTLTISGTGHPGNSGTFLVVAYASQTSVWISNPGAVAGDEGQVIRSGNSAYISSVVPGTNGGQEIISGLTGLSPSVVDSAITVSNAFYNGGDPAPNNNGDQAILGFVSSTSLRILNNPYPNACAAPDYGVGGTSLAPTINWSITQGVTIPIVQNCEMITSLTGITPEDVALVLTVQNVANGSNQGVWEIAGYISSTSVLLNNPNAAPDPNNGGLGWHLGTDYDLSQITLASAPLNSSDAEFFIYDGATFNSGIAKVSDIHIFTEFNYQNFLGTILQSNTRPVWSITGSGELEPDNSGSIYDLSQVSQVYPTLIMTGNAFATSMVNFGANPGVGFTVNLYDASYVDGNFAQGSAGYVSFAANTALSNPLPTSLGGFTGSFNVAYPSQVQTLTPFAGASLPTHVANDPLTPGMMFFDTSTSQAYWWDGGEWVSYSAPSYNTTNIAQGHATTQTTNLAAGDHVIFNTYDFTAGGTNISLDTSSPYSTTPGQPSVGRITLPQGANPNGHLYKLVGNVNQVSGSGNFYLQWWYTNSALPGGANAGNGSRIDDGSNSGDFASHGDCVAYILTNSGSGGDALAELRIMFNNGMTSIGENAAAPIYAWFTVEQIY